MNSYGYIFGRVRHNHILICQRRGRTSVTYAEVEGIWNAFLCMLHDSQGSEVTEMSPESKHAMNESNTKTRSGNQANNKDRGSHCAAIAVEKILEHHMEHIEHISGVTEMERNISNLGSRTRVPWLQEATRPPGIHRHAGAVGAQDRYHRRRWRSRIRRVEAQAESEAASREGAV